MEEIRLTYSESKQFLRDRRQWYLGSYLGFKSPRAEWPNTALSIGTAYHDALAAYYADGTDPVSFMEARATELLKGQAGEDGTVHDDIFLKEMEKEIELLHPMLSGYLDWLEETGLDSDLEITGSERMVNVELVPGIRLLSKIDAPCTVKSTGAKLALEHKTTGDLETPQNLLKIDRQFLTEHLALFLAMKVEGSTNDEAYQACTGILWNAAKKNKRTAKAKPPFYARVDVPHNLTELRNHWHHMVAVGKEIQQARARLDAGESHHTVCPPNPATTSTWDDPFFKISVMLDDGSDWEGALEELYVPCDPLERYQGAERL